MDNYTFKDLLCSSPDSALLEALDTRRDHRDLLPLLDVEVQRSSSRLQRLREYRNALSSPMYCLLPELLSRIFFIYAEDTYTLHDLRWTKLLLVCRRWHDLAMRTPKLWSFIEFSRAHYGRYPGRTIDASDALDLDRVETQLARAKLWPLTLNMELWSPLSDAKSLRLPILLDAQRLSSLSLIGDESHVNSITRLLSLRQYISLQSLKIGSESFMVYGNLDSSLPDNILRDNTPQLQHLWLDFISFDWKFVRGLRTLHVSYHLGTPLTLTQNDILDALVRCPLLEDVDMRIPAALSLLTESSLPSAVSLPHLHTINIWAAAELCAEVTQRLTDVPYTSKIALTTSLSVKDGSSYPPSISSMMSYISGRASVVGAPVIRVIDLHLSGNFAAVPADFEPVLHLIVTGNLYSERYGTLGWPHTVHPDGRSFLGFGTTIPINTLSPETVLVDILQSWPLESVTHVDLRLAGIMTKRMWHALFTMMPFPISVIVRPESDTALALVDTLHELLQASYQRIVINIVLDTSELNHTAAYGLESQQSIKQMHARRTVIRILAYCADIARAGISLDTVEVINDSRGRLLSSRSNGRCELDWSELYRDLKEGFIYDSVLYNADVGPEGVPIMSSLRDN
ncbi:hypothetical protein PENSPDRAFT_758544 [Peniophora sp. CONT]|nr:hypothetical protein PENSPDRAFT_758544 [Peniophora sp. CONT]